MNIKEQIEFAYKEFLSTSDQSRLSSALKTTESVLENPMTNAENRKIADFLCIQINAKIIAAGYRSALINENVQAFNGKANELAVFLEKYEPVAISKGYKNTADFLFNLKTISSQTSALCKELFDAVTPIDDGLGRFVGDEKSSLNAQKKVEEIRLKAEAINGSDRLFGNDAQRNAGFPDLKQAALEVIYDRKDKLEKHIAGLRIEQIGELMELVCDLKSKFPEKNYDYPPSVRETEYDRGVCILSTPVEEEGFLYVFEYAKKYKKRFSIIPANEFNHCSFDVIDNVIDAVKGQGKGIVITGFSHVLNEKFLDEFLFRMIRYAGTIGRVFIIDVMGDDNIYTRGMDVANKHEGHSSTEISRVFLSMPSYQSVISIFESEGMVSDISDKENLKSLMPFMGFIGLNETVNAFRAKHAWEKVGKAYSDENKKNALNYLSRIPSQLQLLGSDWGDYSAATRKDIAKKSDFDYDELQEGNKNNLRNILSCDASLFSKCGALVRYCTLYGNDVNSWEPLSTEEKAVRLTQATRLLMNLLGCDIKPEVEVIENKKWKTKGAAGVCCDGGKRIIYKESCVQDYDFTVKMVCHECFHGFQHFATSCGYADWFFTELGVTKGRVEYWSRNFSEYCGDTSSLTYRVEIVECDANAFADDCFSQSVDIWNKIKFE